MNVEDGEKHSGNQERERERERDREREKAGVCEMKLKWVINKKCGCSSF